MPLVSVVTPSYNMANYLRETIGSVLGQDYPRIEYIVMDGGSTDGSVQLLEGYQGRLSFTSARDEGPSDAVFQGLRRAHGDIFVWLNADDTFLPGAIRKAVDFLERHPDVDVVYGEGWWIDEEGRTISRYPLASVRCQGARERLLHLPARCLHPRRGVSPLRARPARQLVVRLRLMDPHGKGWGALRVFSGIPGEFPHPSRQ